MAALIALSLSFSVQKALAQEAEPVEPEGPVEISRVLGDQYLNIALGVQAPLFIYNPSPDDGEKRVNESNLKAGFTGGLGWAAFVNSNISLGLDIDVAYSPDLNAVSYFSVPITFKGNYFFRSAPFEFPIHLGLGMDILKYKDITSLALIVKTGASWYWNAIQDWSFGLNIMYWWVPELYSGLRDVPSSMTRYGNFLEITISALYNF